MPADPREVPAVCVKALRRAIEDAQHRTGMRVGLPEAHVPLCHAERILAALSAQPSGEGKREHGHRWNRHGICDRCGRYSEDLLDERGMMVPCAAPTSPPASAAPADGGEALRERVIALVRAAQDEAVEMTARHGGLYYTRSPAHADAILRALSRSPVSDDSNGGGA